MSFEQTTRTGHGFSPFSHWPLSELGSIKTYSQIVRDVFGPSLIAHWPLSELSGTIAKDGSGHSFIGTHSNVTLAQGGVDNGELSALYNGTSSRTNVYSTRLASFFNGQEGTLSIWEKPLNATVWADANIRTIFNFYVDSNNFIEAHFTSGILAFLYKAGGVQKSPSFQMPTDSVGFSRITLAWSKTSDNLSLYVNDNLITSLTSLGTFAGALNANYANLGTYYTTQFWNGYLAHAALGNRALSAKEVANLGFGKPTRFTFLGDSISTVVANFTSFVAPGYGRSIINNRAVGGAGILEDSTSTLAQQVAAAENDDADIIIIELGTNDWEPGDMAAIQAEVEAGIIALKTSNPRASIYWLNILPRWTNNTTGPEVDKSLLRAAIAEGCTAQSITCWDSYTTPWFLQSDTSDGLHPIYTGSRKIAQEIWPLLP